MLGWKLRRQHKSKKTLKIKWQEIAARIVWVVILRMSFRSKMKNFNYQVEACDDCQNNEPKPQHDIDLLIDDV